MSLFDQFAGAFNGNSTDKQAAGPLAVVQMLASHEGGLSGLLQKFESSGLGETAQSWVSSGENQSVSSDTVHRVLGSDMMRKVAEKTGLPLDQVGDLVAKYLPQVVDGLTPNGKVEQGSGSDMLSEGEALLKNRFGIG